MSEISRRDLLKAFVPGFWALDFKKGEGIGGFSAPAKFGLVKDVLWITGGITALLSKEKSPKSFKDRILSFKWEQAKGKLLESFIEDLADEYLRLTGTTGLTKADLTGPGRTNFFQNRQDMIKAIREVNSDYQLPRETVWGHADFKTGKVFIDLGTLKEQTTVAAKTIGVDPANMAGVALLDATWHEWGHKDVTESRSGQMLNNPDFYFFSPNSGQNEQFRRYRGAEVFTDTYFGFLRFEEVLIETITLRRMEEQVGVTHLVTPGDYFPDGTSFFPMFTMVTNIPLDTLYQMHATSDFEGIAKLIGSHLPGQEDPLKKGIRLMLGIHQSNSQMIQDTRVHEVIYQAIKEKK